MGIDDYSLASNWIENMGVAIRWAMLAMVLLMVLVDQVWGRRSREAADSSETVQGVRHLHYLQRTPRRRVRVNDNGLLVDFYQPPSLQAQTGFEVGQSSHLAMRRRRGDMHWRGTPRHIDRIR